MKSAVMPTARPMTANPYKPNVKLTKKVRANDPVSRYQQLSTAWRKDSFLSKGANRREGRKL
jgi:hypothetical protein